MTHNLDLRASIELAVQDTIKELKLPHRTARSEANARRLALMITANALASVIASDVANGQNPWPATVAKFRLCREMCGDPIPAPDITECGKRRDDYDDTDDLRINGHYHYADGSCDTEPSYEMGGPA